MSKFIVTRLLYRNGVLEEVNETIEASKVSICGEALVFTSWNMHVGDTIVAIRREWDKVDREE